VVNKDSHQLVEAALKISIKDKPVVRDDLERDLLDIIDLYVGVPIKDIHLGKFLNDLTYTLRQNNLRIPPDLAIMIKALITIEGTARQLCPGLNVIIEAEPHVKRVASRRYRPAVLWKKFKESLSNLIAFQGELPGVLSSIAEKVEKGELNIRFKHENLEGLQDSLDNVSNRLTLAIIIAAMIIGSSMIITTGVEPHLFGYPAFGIFGYCVSGVLGLWLVYTIIRGKRY
jgi:ubiquinone biosynthesis protein